MKALTVEDLRNLNVKEDEAVFNSNPPSDPKWQIWDRIGMSETSFWRWCQGFAQDYRKGYSKDGLHECYVYTDGDGGVILLKHFGIFEQHGGALSLYENRSTEICYDTFIRMLMEMSEIGFGRYGELLDKEEEKQNCIELN